MTLEFFKDNQELMSQCVLWWQGRDQTTTGFPILPSGVTATPAGTWANDLSLGNSKTLKTFNGSTNYISLTDNAAWYFGTGDCTICFWIYPNAMTGAIMGQYADLYIKSFLVLNTNRITWRIYESSSSLLEKNSGTIGSGAWYHVAFVRSNGYIFAVTNGVQGSSTAITAAVTDMAVPFTIGQVNASYANCMLKDVLIWKGRALSQPEIKLLMQLTNPNTGREFELLYPGVRGVE